jgi:hypothetical protein
MDHLELILQLLYNPKTDLVICGDINLNDLEETNRVKQLNALLKTFNLISTVTFPTRICASTSTVTDNIFTDIYKYDYHSVSSLHNGLSDHEAQFLAILFPLKEKKVRQTYSYRKIDNSTFVEFLTLLSYETWDEIFGHKDVNLIFNSFLNTYLRIFYASFPVIKITQYPRVTSVRLHKE